MYLVFIWLLDWMILIRANTLLGPLEGEGGALKISTFLGSSDAHFALCHFRAENILDLRGPSQLFWAQMAPALLVDISEHKKSWFWRPTPSNSPCNGCCPRQNHYTLRHINKWYINVNDHAGRGVWAVSIDRPLNTVKNSADSKKNLKDPSPLNSKIPF